MSLRSSGASSVLRVAIVGASLTGVVALFARHLETATTGTWMIAAAPWAILLLLGLVALAPMVRVDAPELGDAVPFPLASTAGLLASAASFVCAVRAGVIGSLGGIATSILGTGAIAGICASLVGIVRRARPAGTNPLPVWLWIGALGLLLGFPMLGAYGLSDPWETHYAEVAREMLARDDAVSPWWANEGWFHSKPVLLFWLEASSMRLFGAGFRPGEVLGSAAAHPEWAVRLPGVIAAVVGAAILSEGVAARFGRRAGLLGGGLLWTCPFYLMMARQAITDMPMVAGIEVSAGLLLLRGSARPELGPTRFRIGRRHISLSPAWLLTLFAVFLLVSQLAYLTSRGGVPPFSLHPDVVRSGSAGTCGVLPDHPACEVVARHAPWLTPYVQGALVGVLVLMVIQEFTATTERDTLALYGAYLAAAFAAMAKGPLGLVLPVCVFVADTVARKRWSEIRPPTHLVGWLAAALAILPWYIATYARHGRLFYDDLVLRHMLGRALEHLHDVNEQEDTGARYYLAQLAYGGLPLVAMLPAAIRSALRDAKRLPLLVWAALCFALVTVMKTKFHHYVFPVVPPLAMLVGIEIAARERASWRVHLFGACLAALIAADLVFQRGHVEGVSRLMSLLCYRYDRQWPTELAATPLYVGCLLFAALLGPMVLLLRNRNRLGVAILGLPLAAYLSVVYLPIASRHYGQRSTLEAFVRAHANTQEVASVEPLIAYHLNWKGESYYSGNRVAHFIRSGAPFAEYLAARRAKGITQLYVATESTSLAALRSEIGGEASVSRLTSEREGNRFCLVRVTFPTARR